MNQGLLYGGLFLLTRKPTMTLSLQEISDRFEIQDLLYNYADIIDSQEFDKLQDIFTEDAHIDYSAFGGAAGNLEEIIEFLKSAMIGRFPNTQHLNANLQIKVNGDTGTGRIMCFNPQEMKLGEDQSQTYMLGLWYIDTYVRTNKGWRIKTRSEEKSWWFNLPEFMSFD